MWPQELHEHPLPRGKLASAPVHVDDDHQSRSGGEPDRHLVLEIEPAEELLVEPEIVKPGSREEVRHPDRAPVPLRVTDQRMLGHVSLEDPARAGQPGRDRGLLPPDDPASPHVGFVVNRVLAPDQFGRVPQEVANEPVEVVLGVHPLDEREQASEVARTEALHRSGLPNVVRHGDHPSSARGPMPSLRTLGQMTH